MFILFPFGALLVVWSLAYRRREAAVQGKTSWKRTAVTVAILLGLLAGLRFFVFSHPVQGLHLPGLFHSAGKASHARGAAHPTPKAAKTGSDWLAGYVRGSPVVSFAVAPAAAPVPRRPPGGAVGAE